MNCVRICHKKSFANPISSQKKILSVKKNSISNLIFTACVTCKNQVQNRQKIKFRNQFREIEILKNQVQIDKGCI